MDKTINDFKRIPDNLDNLQKQAGIIGIYIIVDNLTGKTYVGSTCDLLSRKSKHEALLNNNKHHNKKMQEAFNDGADLEFIGISVHDRDAAYDMEQATIDDFFHSGLLFNASTNARDGRKSLPITDEIRNKMRISHLGKKVQEATKIKIGNAFRGRKLSQEHIAKMKLARANYVISEETKEKIRQTNLGKKTKS